jgi:hypothetical protein
MTRGLLLALLPFALFVSSATIHSATADPGAPSTAFVPMPPPSNLPRSAQEIVQMRTRTSRTFALPDGRYAATISLQSVNYRGDDGAFRPIDNTFMEVDGDSFVNRANVVQARLPKRLGTAPITFTSGGEWASFELHGSRSAGETDGDSVTYPDAVQGVDARYTMTGDLLQEVFTLKSRNAPRAFTFDIRKSDGLVVSLTDAGSVNFRSTTGGLAFSFTAPTLVDARGAAANPDSAVTSKLVATSSGYELTLTPNRTWLSAASRAWPVQLDPSVGRVNECNIANGSANYAYCAGVNPLPTIDFGMDSSGALLRSLLAWNVSSIPSTSTVASADLALYFLQAQGAVKTDSLSVYRLTHAYTTSVTWNKYDGISPWAAPGGDFDPAATATNNSGGGTTAAWEHWYPTGLVQGWVDGSIANNGMLLKQSAESLQTQFDFASSHYFQPQFAPTLTVTYTATLNQPTLLTSSGASLSWQAYSGSGFSSYEVHRSTTPQFSPTFATRLATITSASQSSYTDTSGTPETTYYYKVLTNGLASNEVVANLPATGETVRVIQGQTETAGSYIWNGTQSGCANTGSDQSLRIGNDGASVSRALLKFDLSSLPSGAIVADADVSLWRQQASGAISVDVEPVTAAWTEGTGTSATTCSTADGTTWSARSPGSAWATPGGDHIVEAADNSQTVPPLTAPGWDALDVTNPLIATNEGEASEGFLIKLTDETVAAAARWYSDDAADPMRRPRLEVTYYESGSLPGSLSSGLVGAGNPNFGGKELFSSFFHRFYGVQSAMRPSSGVDFSLRSDTIGVMRVVVENVIFSGLVQTGFGQTNNGSTGMDACGPRTHLTYYYEFAYSAPNYQCSWVDDPSANQAIPFRYDFSRDFVAERILGSCPGSTGGAGTSWRITIDAYSPACVSLWKSGHHLMAGGEINTYAGNGLQPGAIGACYGCDQKSPWRRGTGVNTSGATWYTIRHAHNISTQTLGWTVSPLPGPFTVRNSG